MAAAFSISTHDGAFIAGLNHNEGMKIGNGRRRRKADEVFRLFFR